MEIFRYPDRSQWASLSVRALAGEAASVKEAVAAIIDDVRRRGDEALIEYEKRFTGASLESLRVTLQEIDSAVGAISPMLKEAVELASKNIEAFHRAQTTEVVVQTSPGVKCVQRQVPISKVGLYIPGGNSPLFSTVLMLAIPARLAGCKSITLCTPALADGSVHPAILYAAAHSGVHNIYKTGGAQAIAAMAYGTATIEAVYKIFGPGNRFVTEAKQQVNGMAAIDMPAGPSEVLVIADDEADISFVASDFLSQAEHGPDSQSILVTTSDRIADGLEAEIDRLLATLPRREMIAKSLSHSRVVLLDDDDKMMDFANQYAPEHLILNHRRAMELQYLVTNAGSVFLGPYSTESAGDYASGTNHTLPTSGYARTYSGVNMDSFTKKITFQHLDPQGVLAIGPAVEAMAENEGLYAHKLAMTLRLNSLR